MTEPINTAKESESKIEGSVDPECNERSVKILTNKDDRTVLHETAGKIAVVLGWNYVQANNINAEGKLTWCAEIEREDGFILSIYKGRKKEGMFSISPTWPKDSTGETANPVFHNEKRPEINCSVKKTAEQIARDIKRRLLTKTEPLFKTAMGWVVDRNEYQAQSQLAFEKLLKIDGVQDCSSKLFDELKIRFEGAKGHGYVEIISGTKADITLSVHPDIAAKVIKNFVKL